MKNSVGVRKLAELLIDEGRQNDQSFERIAETLYESRSDKTFGLLIEYQIKSGKYDKTTLIFNLRQLASHSQKQVSKPVKELIKQIAIWLKNPFRN